MRAKTYFPLFKVIALALILVWGGIALFRLSAPYLKGLKSLVIQSGDAFYISGPKDVEENAIASYDFLINVGPSAVSSADLMTVFRATNGSDVSVTIIGGGCRPHAKANEVILFKGGIGKCAGTVRVKWLSNPGTLIGEAGSISKNVQVNVLPYVVLGPNPDPYDQDIGRLYVHSPKATGYDTAKVQFNANNISAGGPANVTCSAPILSSTSNGYIVSVSGEAAVTTGTNQISCTGTGSFGGVNQPNYHRATFTISFKARACQNNIVEFTEECDDGNSVDGDGCSLGCQLEQRTFCGNKVIEPPEEQCDDGNLNDDDGCSNICKIPVCGDSKKQGFEPCDDGNKVNEDACTNVCKLAACGDSFKQAGEECDDGNQVDTDACTNACKVPVCGNGLQQDKEQCDDGNVIPGDGCDGQCAKEECGNGVKDFLEECDDGNKTDIDDCTNACQDARCGDKIIQVGRDEACDDGNTVNIDGCTNTCLSPNCGDGVVQTASGEECDDKNKTDTDACTNICKKAFCGDKIIEAGKESCDDGNAVDTDACVTCQPAKCGDSKVQAGVEQCDDGNQVNEDSCTNVCKPLACGDGFKQEGETCDDGKENGKNGKCTETCKIVAPATSGGTGGTTGGTTGGSTGTGGQTGGTTGGTDSGTSIWDWFTGSGGTASVPPPIISKVLPANVKMTCGKVHVVQKLSKCFVTVPRETLTTKLVIAIPKLKITAIQQLVRNTALSTTSTFSTLQTGAEGDTWTLHIDYIEALERVVASADFAIVDFELILKSAIAADFPLSLTAQVKKNSEILLGTEPKRTRFQAEADLTLAVTVSGLDESTIPPPPPPTGSFKVDAPPPAPPPPDPKVLRMAAGFCFDDPDNSMTSEEWELICEAKTRGFVSGTEKEGGVYFNPNQPVNRAEAAKIITSGILKSLGKMNEAQFTSMEEELLKLFKKQSWAVFSDIRFEKGRVLPWFAVFVALANRDGIIGGYPDGTFQPSNKITTLEAYKMIVEAARIGSKDIAVILQKKAKETRYGQWYEKYLGVLDEVEVPYSSDPYEFVTRKDFVITALKLLRP